VHEAAWNVAVLRVVVADLEAGRVDGVGVSSGMARAAIAGLSGSVARPAEAVRHVFVEMYDAERERLVKWSKACRDAGVDERLVAVTEAQASTLREVLSAAMVGLLALVVAAVPEPEVAGVRRAWDAGAGRVVADAVRRVHEVESGTVASGGAG